MDVFIQQFINAMSLGVMYALIAVGFTLFFGVIEVVNFAHGEVFMLGAFAAMIASAIFAAVGSHRAQCFLFYSCSRLLWP